MVITDYPSVANHDFYNHPAFICALLFLQLSNQRVFHKLSFQLYLMTKAYRSVSHHVFLYFFASAPLVVHYQTLS